MPPKPSVGRIVHYGHKGGLRAAVVSEVFSDGDVVELHVFWLLGADTDQARPQVTNVRWSANLQDGYWSWPTRM